VIREKFDLAVAVHESCAISGINRPKASEKFDRAKGAVN